MSVFYFFVLTLYFFQSRTASGYLLPDGVQIRSSIPKLPQYATYGRSLVLIGGNQWDNNTEIHDTVIRLAGGKGVAKLGIINAASADPLDSFTYYHDIFLQYGALEVNRIMIDLNHTDNNAKQDVINLIYNQTGFFFGGGDQARVIQSFMGKYGDFSPALIALHQMFDSGAVIAGSSAGTVCLTANYMIMDGVSYDALLFGSFPDQAPDQYARDSPVIYGSFGGLGFLKGYILDSHFSQRGREGRLIRLLADTKGMARGTSYGIGVDENTALVVTQADTAMAKGEVIGVSGVSFFDLSKARVPQSNYFHINNVYMTYLTNGDVITLKDWQVTFSSKKTSIGGHEKYDNVMTSSDIFYGSDDDTFLKSEFVRVATSTFDAKNSFESYGTSRQSHPRFRIDFSASGHDAEGWVERVSSFITDIHSYMNLRVSITDTF